MEDVRVLYVIGIILSLLFAPYDRHKYSTNYKEFFVKKIATILIAIVSIKVHDIVVIAVFIQSIDLIKK